MRRFFISIAAALALACGTFASAEIRIQPHEDQFLTASFLQVEKAMVDLQVVAKSEDYRIVDSALEPASLQHRMRGESAGFVFKDLQRARIERAVPC